MVMTTMAVGSMMSTPAEKFSLQDLYPPRPARKRDCDRRRWGYRVNRVNLNGFDLAGSRHRQGNFWLQVLYPPRRSGLDEGLNIQSGHTPRGMSPNGQGRCPT